MEKASNIIQDALREILVAPADVPINAYQAQAGIFYLNAMMEDFSVNGINLGYTRVDSLGDLVTIPLGAIDGVVKNLAVVISPLFKDSFISQELIIQAQDAMTSLLNISFESPSYTPYSENLPMGSGNYNWHPGQFYIKPESPILTESGGNIAPEVAPDDS